MCGVQCGVCSVRCALQCVVHYAVCAVYSAVCGAERAYAVAVSKSLRRWFSMYFFVTGGLQSGDLDQLPLNTISSTFVVSIHM